LITSPIARYIYRQDSEFQKQGMADFVIEGRAYTVESKEPGVSEAALADFEHQHQLRLPEQLRAYYLRFNGGLPYPVDLPEYSAIGLRLVWAEGVRGARGGDMAYFSGLFKINHPNPSLDYASTWHDFKHRVPAGYLGFGSDPSGSLFLIGTAEHNVGEIFFWSRQYEADVGGGEAPSDVNIAFVAPSFKDMLLAMRVEPADDETVEQWIARVYST
jgi:hypothetical protein